MSPQRVDELLGLRDVDLSAGCLRIGDILHRLGLELDDLGLDKGALGLEFEDELRVLLLEFKLLGLETHFLNDKFFRLARRELLDARVEDIDTVDLHCPEEIAFDSGRVVTWGRGGSLLDGDGLLDACFRGVDVLVGGWHQAGRITAIVLAEDLETFRAEGGGGGEVEGVEDVELAELGTHGPPATLHDSSEDFGALGEHVARSLGRSVLAGVLADHDVGSAGNAIGVVDE